ncbi:hypothetical protein H4R19_001007 [Coemansia spiralis]|nr:hypothetical protein H4R19_001007 [Coemansia spiralis]
MRPGRPASSSSLAGSGSSSSISIGSGRRQEQSPADDGDQCTGRPATASARPSEDSPAEDGGDDDDYAKVLDVWWDRILQFFVRHRATAALVAWFGVFAFDVLDLHMPAEWLVFTFFSFSVFVQVFGMSALLFAALAVAMTVLSVAVYCLLPFSATSLLSTVVVCMLLVRGVHGLDARGWLVTALMSASRLNSPWCETLPDYLQAPVAAYCASFGLLWIVYHSSGRLEHLIDPACLLLGVVPPQTPRVSVVEVGDSSVVVCWSQDPAASGLLVAEPVHSRHATGEHHKGAALQLDTPPPTPDEPSTGTASSPAGDATVRGCGPSAADRRHLPDAQVVRHEIEVDGRIVGACSRADELVRIQGLQPARTYQVRVWALSQSRGRAPSAPVFVTTAATPGADAPDGSVPTDQLAQSAPGGIPADMESVHKEITAAREATVELEAAAAALREQADAECARLQEEAAALRAKRKETENANAAQRESIREMETEKRQLDKTRASLCEEIAAAAARRQRARDRQLDREHRAEEHLRQARALQAKVESERRDHENDKMALISTIDSLKLEVASAAQRVSELSQEQDDVARQLQSKRAELSAQEKENAGVDGRIKKAILRRRQLKEAQRESATIVARLQAEVDALEPQLDKAVAQRRQREAAISSLATATSRRPPAHPAALGSNLGRRPAAVASVPAAGSYAPVSLPPRLRSGTGHADAGSADPGAAGGRHMRSSSFAIDSLAAGGAAAPLALGYATQDGIRGLGRLPAGSAAARDAALGYDGVPARSADLGDLLSLWGRKSPGVAGGMSAAPGRHTLLWANAGSPPPASLSTTAAEASALSILEDTDLAYPTPKRETYSSGSPFGGSAGYGGVPFPQPPPEAHPGLGGKPHHPALDRVLANPLQGPGPPPARLGAGSGWPDADYIRGLPLGAGASGHPASGISSTSGFQTAPPYAAPLADVNGPFVLRAASPAEQPQHLFSGDVLGMRRPADIYTPGGRARPYVAPIGAPGRRRNEGSPAPRRPSARSHESLPLAGAAADTDDAPQPGAESRSCRVSMDHSAARSSPFNESLYCEHSFWERDASGDQ